MSGATGRTVKPSLGVESGAAPRRRLSFSVLALGAVSVVLGLCFAKSISHRHTRPALVMQIVSGSPVLKKSSDGDNVRWHSSKATVYLDSSLDAVSSHARDAVQVGFGTWLSSGAKLPDLSFDSTKGATFGETPNGKSEIMYGPITIPGHEDNLALTITFSDPKTGEVLEADMIFNSNHPYALLTGAGSSDDNGSQQNHLSTASANSGGSSCSDQYDLQSVATHEAGHFFGLGEDYDVKTATMYYTTGRCETNKRVLLTSDETTMDSLYVAGETGSTSDPSTDTGKGCGGARIGQGKMGTDVSLLSLLGLFGFVSWRRRRR